MDAHTIIFVAKGETYFLTRDISRDGKLILWATNTVGLSTFPRPDHVLATYATMGLTAARANDITARALFARCEQRTPEVSQELREYTRIVEALREN